MPFAVLAHELSMGGLQALGNYVIVAIGHQQVLRSNRVIIVCMRQTCLILHAHIHQLKDPFIIRGNLTLKRAAHWLEHIADNRRALWLHVLTDKQLPHLLLCLSRGCWC